MPDSERNVGRAQDLDGGRARADKEQEQQQEYEGLAGDADQQRDAGARAQERRADESDEEFAEEVRRRAHEIYLSRGAEDGDDVSDWLEAERLVRFGRGIGGNDTRDQLTS